MNKHKVDRTTTVDWGALPHLLDTAQVVEVLNVSKSFLTKSRCDGAIGGRTIGPKFTKIGKRVKYKKTELQRWIEELQQFG